MATRQPARYHCAATRWSRDALVAARAPQGRTWTRSRSSIWRLRDDADLKPHRRVSGLNRHAPDCEAKAPNICALYLNARRFFAPGRVGMCRDAQTGRQIRPRQDPPPPLAPGKPENRAQESIRHGVRAWIASLVVATGQGVWQLGQTRTRAACATPLATGVQPLPAMQRSAWVVAHLQTPWSLAVCRLVAQWGHVPCGATDRHRGGQRRAVLSDPTHPQVFHFTPKHGSWLHQVA
jgi:hypothetical protein